MKKLGFIGVGNMGGAIIKGINRKLGNTAVFAYDSDPSRLRNINSYGATASANIPELVKKCDFLLLAVKPQQLDAVLEEIKASGKKSVVIISICAGISAEYIRERTFADAKVVLVMPNTPMMLNCGASAMSRGDGVSDEEFDFAKKIISSCGTAEVVPIDKMKEVIAVNASSPAFIYLFAKSFMLYAEKAGIDEAAALRLFSQALIGSAKMMTDSGMTVDELIKQVSSPGGTTLAGLQELYDGKLTDTVIKCCEACTRRAYELGEKK